MKGRDVLFSSKTDEYETPTWLYHKLDVIYHFDLDPCCTIKNQKCEYGLGLDVDSGKHILTNGLQADWSFSNVFVNPPYSDVTSWVDKAHGEVHLGECPLVVMLLPARTGMKWFTRGVLPYYTKLIFIEGRLKFEGTEHSAPFDSLIVVFTKDNHDHSVEVWKNKSDTK